MGTVAGGTVNAVSRKSAEARPLLGVKTKIIATIGPAAATAERLAQLVEAGVGILRLNMAHGQHAWHETVLERIRAVGADLDRPLAVLADLGGPKIRLGPVSGGSVDCKVGQVFRVVADPAAMQATHDLTLTNSAVVHQLAVGDRVLLADGVVSMQVEHKDEVGAVCRVLQPGEIRSGTGVNVPGSGCPGGPSRRRTTATWAGRPGGPSISSV